MTERPAAPRWLVRGEDALPAGTRWLSPGEAARAAALVRPKRRTEYLLRRLAVKHTAAALTGRPVEVAALARIEVPNTPGGAPYVLLDGDPAGFDVSVTDRAGWAVCVTGRRVGCDLELVEPRSPAFVRDFLTPAEQRFVAARTPGDDRAAAANLIWSAKESALKLLGTGLRRDTRSVEVTAAAPGPDGWGTLAVRDAEGPPLSGWWRREGAFLLTVATAAPGPPPVALDPPGVLAAAAPRHSWLERPSPR
ncbi:4'-phosphopantetheinyl transferase family protein [Actinoplanes nipponensis]|uniref:4'-phosphopantetheinyl transferase family protein n=1 Tax=Actinoplanes nipponensis TaxID=135950 RepID=UPI001942C6BA|nr:4'-phosphopantetheinyl transferase superfamily protein [Actinoplanes nipponensis]